MNFLKKLAIFAVLVLGAIACQTLQPTPSKFEVNASTIQFIGILNSDLTAAPLAQLKAVPEGGDAQIFIFSASGDPRVVSDILDAMKGKTTTCFATVAGGGAFTILQACTYRLVGEKAMAGTAKFQVQHAANIAPDNPELLSAIKAVEFYEDLAIPLEADRLGIDHTEYSKMLEGRGFAWLTTEEVMNHKGADAKVEFSCAEGTRNGTIERTIHLGPQSISLTMTQCPVGRQLVSPPDAPAGLVGQVLGIPMIPNGNDQGQDAAPGLL